MWDLINVNNPWAREMMYPEGLIRPLPRDRFEPMFENMMPAFHPPYEWAMDKSGQELLGMTQRFGPFNFVVNTDKISRATAEDEGFNVFFDSAMSGKYGVLTYDNWNIYHMCVAAGVHPFKSHTAEEIAAFTDACKKVFNGAKLLTDDLVQMNLALINGEIDAYFTGGTYTASPARFDGATQVRGITPKSGADGRQGRHRVDRADLRGRQSRSVAARRRVPRLHPASGRLESSWRSPKAPTIRCRRWAIPGSWSSSAPRSSTPSSGTPWKRRWRTRRTTTSTRTTRRCTTSTPPPSGIGSREARAASDVRGPRDPGGSMEQSRAPFLELSGLTKRFGDFAAVRDVNLEIREGEFFTLVGPSGSGKTTMIRLLVGMDRPTSGDIRLNGESLNAIPANRRPTCMVFQNLALFPHKSVGENIEFLAEDRGCRCGGAQGEGACAARAASPPRRLLRQGSEPVLGR